MSGKIAHKMITILVDDTQLVTDEPVMIAGTILIKCGVKMEDENDYSLVEIKSGHVTSNRYYLGDVVPLYDGMKLITISNAPCTMAE
jgi:hypothetical protein